MRRRYMEDTDIQGSITDSLTTGALLVLFYLGALALILIRQADTGLHRKIAYTTLATEPSGERT